MVVARSVVWLFDHVILKGTAEFPKISFTNKEELLPAAQHRWTIYFSGRVQGVGFRASTEQIAAGFAVTGYVRNLRDGRVEVVAEGTESEVRRFLDEIRARLGHYIREQTQTTDTASGEWDDFAVHY